MSDLTFIPLKGLERVFSLPSPNCIYRIADSFRIQFEGGAVSKELLLRHGKEAAVRTCCRHPKMRSSIITDQDLGKLGPDAHKGAPPPPYFAVSSPESFAANASVASQLFTVLENPAKDERLWEKQVQEIMNSPADRTALPLWRFVLVLNADAAGEQAHLIVVADHAVADGFSTSKAAHDFFSALTEVAAATAAAASPASPLPLPKPLDPLPPAMDLMADRVNGLARACRGPIIKIASSMTMAAYRKYPAVVPLRPEIASIEVKEPFPLSPSAALFATGSAAASLAARKRCKEEGITMHGALLACILAGCSRVALRQPEPVGFFGRLFGGGGDASRQRIAMNLDIDFNVRKRLSPPLGDEHMGLLINWGRVESLAPDNKGCFLDERFWDVARRAKADTEKLLQSFEAWFAPLFYENKYQRLSDVVSLLGNGVARGGVLSDANVSNIGPYPFDPLHSFNHLANGAGAGASAGGSPSSAPGIRILTHHLINGASPVANNCIWFFSSVADTPAYSLSYKSEHEITRRIFADVVAACEGISTILKDETLGQVAERLCKFGKAPAAGAGAGAGAGVGAGAAVDGGAASPPFSSVYEEVRAR